MASSSDGNGYLGDSLSKSERLTYIFVLGALTALGPFTVDLYLPAFPLIESEFSVDPAAVQLTLTGTMVGFAFGQLIMGPLSDRIGRRGPLIISAFVHIGASIGIALAPSIALVGVLRILQGFGASAGGVVSIATVRDLFGGRGLVKMLSRLALVNGFAPVIAPVLGSWLLSFTSWRGVFWVLAGYGIVVGLAVLFFIVETLPAERRKQQQRSLLARYRILLHDRIYVGAVLVAATTSTGLFAYLSASPFLLQQVYGFSARGFGTVFAINSIGIVLGIQTSSRLMHKRGIGPQWILAGTTGVNFILALLMVGLDLLQVGFWGLAIPLWFFILVTGFAFPAQQVLALSGHGDQAGTAASLFGALNFGIAGIVSPIIGVLGVNSAVPMAGVMAVAALLGAVLLWSVIRPRSTPSVLD